jgi:hypothetical protein
MKTKLLILVMILFVQGILAQERTITVTRTCVVCSQEWKDIEKTSYSFYSGNATLFNWYSEDKGGYCWDVGIRDKYLCKYCADIYATKWREELQNVFDNLLQTAIKEQLKYAEKVKLDMKIKKQKELLQKLESLKKEIEEIK